MLIKRPNKKLFKSTFMYILGLWKFVDQTQIILFNSDKNKKNTKISFKQPSFLDQLIKQYVLVN